MPTLFYKVFHKQLSEMFEKENILNCALQTQIIWCTKYQTARIEIEGALSERGLRPSGLDCSFFRAKSSHTHLRVGLLISTSLKPHTFLGTKYIFGESHLNNDKVRKYQNARSWLQSIRTTSRSTEV